MPDNRRLGERLNARTSRWLRVWVLWAIIYATGFGILWIVDPVPVWPYYAWAIGWVLAKAVWDRREAARLLRDLDEGRH